MLNNLKWWVVTSLLHKQKYKQMGPACVSGLRSVSGNYENIWRTTLVTDKHIIQITLGFEKTYAIGEGRSGGLTCHIRFHGGAQVLSVQISNGA